MPSLSGDFSSQVASSTTTFLGNVSPLLTLVLGVLIGAVVIEVLIGAIRHR